MLLKKVFEVTRDSHHSTSYGIDACLDSLFMGSGRLLGHLLGGG